MRMTDFHSKFYAYELTKRCAADSAEKLAGALVDAQVELNPHQVDAALFAFRSPLARGALLADEVGLGKTIEAGLVLSQKWAERKRKILVVAPANLRKQWMQELLDKFHLPSLILEKKSHGEALRRGELRPFAPSGKVVVCSYQFAYAKAAEVAAVDWDMVVVDEAHRLRNVYKPRNVTANVLRTALARAPKLLLTATPLQNSLLELYGLVSFIDEHAFGDLDSFREQYAQLDAAAFDTLKARLAPLCHRTLRKQVLEYVSYTNRIPVTEEFTPDESEDRLYNLVTEYLRRDDLQALPSSQRSLMTLVLRKLLASSSFAIAGALDSLIGRLQLKLGGRPPATARKTPAREVEDDLADDYEGFDETADEWPGEPPDTAPLGAEDREAIRREVQELTEFRELAVGITQNAKGRTLLATLERAFAEAAKHGGARKAIIFTESRRTQEYVQRLLADSPHAEGVLLFNGSNNDPRSKAIYSAWARRNAGTDRLTGSKTADMRSALVDCFREEGTIMIATEAAAEGINLQFCSLVINYDLPWNPQRIEQRIGRCHRWGQKFDVVVVNLINRNNEADRRVFDLLDQKFSLFKGVFGASDEILGAVESGVDFERRIAEIYRQCRTPEEIRVRFDRLQAELAVGIDAAMSSTRRKLLENFDAEVHEKLRFRKGESEAFQGRFEKLLMRLTRHELAAAARFEPGDDTAFRLLRNPFPEVEAREGRYELPRRSGEAHLYRLHHPLAENLIRQARGRVLAPAEVVFDYEGALPREFALQPYRGRSGEATVAWLAIESLDQTEEHLLVAAIADDGDSLDPETAAKLFLLSAAEVRPADDFMPDPRLAEAVERQRQGRLAQVERRNAKLFEDEAAKLDGWAEDRRLALEHEIKELDRQIKEAKRGATAAAGLAEKLAVQKLVKELEAKRTAKRKSLFVAQDEIDAHRDGLIAAVEAKLQQQVRLETLYSLRWRIM